jgi:hypothetical protein
MKSTAKLPPVEIYTPERKAEFLLNNSVTQEGYDEACRAIREDFGLDPAKIPNTDPNERALLMTRAEFDMRMAKTLARLANEETETRRPSK